MWEQINRLFLREVDRDADRRDLDDRTHDSSRRSSKACICSRASPTATMSHGEGWHFIQLGRFLERPRTTARHARTSLRASSRPSPSADADGKSTSSGSALLRRAAFEAYLPLLHRGSAPDRVAEFLLLNADFPRSVRFAAARSRPRSGHRAGSYGPVCADAPSASPAGCARRLDYARSTSCERRPSARLLRHRPAMRRGPCRDVSNLHHLLRFGERWSHDVHFTMSHTTRFAYSSPISGKHDGSADAAPERRPPVLPLRAPIDPRRAPRVSGSNRQCRASLQYSEPALELDRRPSHRGHGTRLRSPRPCRSRRGRPSTSPKTGSSGTSATRAGLPCSRPACTRWPTSWASTLHVRSTNGPQSRHGRHLRHSTTCPRPREVDSRSTKP